MLLVSFICYRNIKKHYRGNKIHNNAVEKRNALKRRIFTSQSGPESFPGQERKLTRKKDCK